MPATPAPPRVVRVAAAQTQPVPGDIAANAAVAAELIATAATAGATVVVFPSCSYAATTCPCCAPSPNGAP